MKTDMRVTRRVISTVLLVAIGGTGCSDDAPDARATGEASAMTAPAATGPAASGPAAPSARSSATDSTSASAHNSDSPGVDNARATGGLLDPPSPGTAPR